MDVFSRLMMDRIIFLGAPIDDYVANIIQAQLLYLNSADPSKDIQVYFNTPGGGVHAGLGIYDTMQYTSCDVATIFTGMAASMGAVLLELHHVDLRLHQHSRPRRSHGSKTGFIQKDSSQTNPPQCNRYKDIMGLFPPK